MFGQKVLIVLCFCLVAAGARADQVSPPTTEHPEEQPAKPSTPKPHIRKPGKPAVASKGGVGYVDLNRDGVNDLFTDANGDGVNDVTKKKYPHLVDFKDEDGDGINDLFVDRDGDGVNDLSAHYTDSNGDGICDNVIDHNGDGINDITGVEYNHRSLEGYRYGFMDEEHGKAHAQFVDEDGDGMNDSWQHNTTEMHSVEGMDVFIDEDGDGICDGRSFLGRQRRSMPEMRGKDQGRMGPGKGHSGEGMDDSGKERGGHRMGGGK